jgi:hypothetical protein
LLAKLADAYSAQQRPVQALDLAQQATYQSEAIAPEPWGISAAVAIGQALSEAGDADAARRIADAALERLRSVEAFHPVYGDLAPAVSALLDAQAYVEAYELGFTVGGFGGYMLDQAPPPTAQARALRLAACGWRHARDAPRLAEAMRRGAALVAAVDADRRGSCDHLELLLTRAGMLTDDGDRAAAINSARTALAIALRIPFGNDPRSLIDTLLALDQPALAQEAGRKIQEAIAERDHRSPWWRSDRHRRRGACEGRNARSSPRARPRTDHRASRRSEAAG